QSCQAQKLPCVLGRRLCPSRLGAVPSGSRLGRNVTTIHTKFNSRTILQYYRGSHNTAIHVPYAGRAIFHPANGSLLLEDVQESDSGIYKVTANVGDRESLRILLEVLSKWWAWEGGATFHHPLLLSTSHKS
uniref:Immunoglobulin V-set domain-containing protein n=1 Tax=Falco tinnunculus TaxID=100819 RepID=A0A8C4U870_FALTI